MFYNWDEFLFQLAPWQSSYLFFYDNVGGKLLNNDGLNFLLKLSEKLWWKLMEKLFDDFFHQNFNFLKLFHSWCIKFSLIIKSSHITSREEKHLRFSAHFHAHHLSTQTPAVVSRCASANSWNYKQQKKFFLIFLTFHEGESRHKNFTKQERNGAYCVKNYTFIWLAI